MSKKLFNVRPLRGWTRWPFRPSNVFINTKETFIMWGHSSSNNQDLEFTYDNRVASISSYSSCVCAHGVPRKLGRSQFLIMQNVGDNHHLPCPKSFGQAWHLSMAPVLQLLAPCPAKCCKTSPESQVPMVLEYCHLNYHVMFYTNIQRSSWVCVVLITIGALWYSLIGRYLIEVQAKVSRMIVNF